MKQRLGLSFDSDLLESVSAEFDLRGPNKQALRQLVFTLDGGEYDPAVMQVLSLATGVGKTYLMAAFIEYLRLQGVRNVVVVTPGKTVQAKTVGNFTPGSPRFITGSSMPPEVVTPQDYSAWVARSNGAAVLSYGREVPVLTFIFNIQQLIAPSTEGGVTRGPTQDAVRRKPRRFDENAGVLFDYLKTLDDLVVIADESHLYSVSASSFNAALKELDPAVTVGLTASHSDHDEVIFEYPLYKAIRDKYVKAPVLAFRKSKYGDDLESEEQQLRDALQLRDTKQVHYNAYSTRHSLPRVNAVVFVVCSDVDHATQVTGLLRSPEYLGREQAVLQIDSKHDDDATLRLLEGLDGSNSPVLAVVSVNKLKEGWDVKNIAVVVTLRAMASEVLTQQTMGRGLRLPFGKYTEVWQIDQLDIIAHQSFRELLAAENVLRQFGLEEAVDHIGAKQVVDAIQKAADHEATTDPGKLMPGGGGAEEKSETEGSSATHSGSQSTSAATQENLIPLGGGSEGPSVGIRLIDGTDLDTNDDGELQVVTVKMNHRFAHVNYEFPVTMMTIKQPQMDLSEIDDMRVEEAARRVTSSGDVLHRKEIVAALGKGLRVADAESAEVDSIPVDTDEAKRALAKLVMNIPLVSKTIANSRYTETYLVPKFMRKVGFEQWTVKSLDSAQTQLQKVVHNFAVEVLRDTREIPTIHPKKLPPKEIGLRFGEHIYDQIESRDEFVRGRVYRGWFKSLFEAESFDSFTGEYVLARLLNTDPHIVWWHRLHRQDDAFIYYNAKDRYFPDFVALDDEGVHWIIEGKDKRGRDDARVQAKRKAAEALVRRLAAEEQYEGQSWGYLIAYEDDTAEADSWKDLKSLAQPISNVL